MLWFSKDQEPPELSSQELHFLIVCLYPSLKGVPYEICRAGGPGHQIIVSLHIADSSKIPHQGEPFIPFFDVEKLKELIGRKGRLKAYYQSEWECSGVSSPKAALNVFPALRKF